MGHCEQDRLWCAAGDCICTCNRCYVARFETRNEMNAKLAAAETRAERAEAQLPAMRKALGLIPEATPEQVAYHVECMARDVPRLNAEKVAQWERAERAEADARTEAGYVNQLGDAIDPLLRAIGFVVATASVAEYARGVAAALATVKALTAEVTRLREALEQVAKACPQCAGTGVYYHDRCKTCREVEWDNRCHAPVCCIARAALATATAKGG